MKLPYIEIEFTKAGLIHRPKKLKEALQLIEDENISDLFVISHGWNNDMADARTLYKKLIDLFAKELQKQPGSKKFGVLAVLWPSKKFTDEELIPGGGAASVSVVSDKKKLLLQLKELENAFDSTDSAKIIKEAQNAAKLLDTNDSKAAQSFVKQMTKLLSSIKAVKNEPEDEAAASLKTQNAKPLLLRLEKVLKDEPPKPEGGASTIKKTAAKRGQSGGAAGMNPIKGLVTGVKGLVTGAQGLVTGARNLLNFVTYYQMKERAGNVGKLGLKRVLEKIKETFPSLKLHLIGHSFGARLVTSATTNLDNSSIDTLILLQAAFSHYAFASNYDEGKDGMFRAAVVSKKVKGPIIISHTHNDIAVGKAYAIASRIARQSGAFIGGANDLYGGLGANGAQTTPEAVNDFKLHSSSVYNFKAGKIYNLNADSCIAGHSEICNQQVARVVIKAVS
jgi:hypothetical protein